MNLPEEKNEREDPVMGDSHFARIVLILITVATGICLAFCGASTVIANQAARQEYDSMINSCQADLRAQVQNYESYFETEWTQIKRKNPEYSDVAIEYEMQIRISQILSTFRFAETEDVYIAKLEKSEGGDDYATIIADSNGVMRVGTKLSTKPQDARDAFPYQQELDSILTQGNASFGFYQEENSNLWASGEWQVCAGYYEKCGWIISIHEQVPTFASFSENYRAVVIPDVIIWTILIIAVGFIITILAIRFAFRKAVRQIHVYGRELQRQIDEDVLTEASSRRKGIRLLEDEFDRQRMLGRFDTVVMMIDMDYFKGVNDTYGHAIGDEALKDVVEAIRKVSRNADDIIRWGGDEFIGIFRGMTEENLAETEKRIKNAVSNVHVSYGGNEIRVSASIGVSFFHEDDTSYMDAVRRADESLYRAKHGNRARMKAKKAEEEKIATDS